MAGTRGRKKGVPNKVTADVRATFARALEANAPKLEAAIATLLEQDDPGRGVDALLRLSERFIPTLARVTTSLEDVTDSELVEVLKKRIAAARAREAGEQVIEIPTQGKLTEGA